MGVSYKIIYGQSIFLEVFRENGPLIVTAEGLVFRRTVIVTNTLGRSPKQMRVCPSHKVMCSSLKWLSPSCIVNMLGHTSEKSNQISR
jgi:hypothetical protein